MNTSTSRPAGPGWQAWLATAWVADDVRALRPDYAVLLIAADGLRPGPSDGASDAILADAEQRAAKPWGPVRLPADRRRWAGRWLALAVPVRSSC